MSEKNTGSAYISNSCVFLVHSPTYLVYQFYTREKFGENIIETSQKMQNSSFSIPNNSDYYSNNTKVD